MLQSVPPQCLPSAYPKPQRFACPCSRPCVLDALTDSLQMPHTCPTIAAPWPHHSPTVVCPPCPPPACAGALRWCVPHPALLAQEGAERGAAPDLQVRTHRRRRGGSGVCAAAGKMQQILRGGARAAVQVRVPSWACATATGRELLTQHNRRTDLAQQVCLLSTAGVLTQHNRCADSAQQAY